MRHLRRNYRFTHVTIGHLSTQELMVRLSVQYVPRKTSAPTNSSHMTSDTMWRSYQSFREGIRCGFETKIEWERSFHLLLHRDPKLWRKKRAARLGETEVPWSQLHLLYHYLRNFCNLIGGEQRYLSLIWNTYHGSQNHEIVSSRELRWNEGKISRL